MINTPNNELKDRLINKDRYAGLSSQEATDLLEKFGLNEIKEEKNSSWLNLLKKFWGPVPWMLEVTISLQVLLGKTMQAAIIAALLILNAVLGYIQEGKAQNALALLRNQLTVMARVLRDSNWKLLQANQLVPGDVVYLRMGDIIPADLVLLDGQISVDQSTLTGESLPVEAIANTQIFAGTVIKQGEGTARVVATGAQTKFGKTASLLQFSKTNSHMNELVFTIVRYLVIADLLLAVVVAIFAFVYHAPWTEILPYILILLIASVPIALPAVFTLALAIGSTELAKEGVLVTRLPAIEEAAAMNVLASDKTGTLTENKLSLKELVPYPPYSKTDLLYQAALASSEATQDAIDTALFEAFHKEGLELNSTVNKFIPFDPATKRSEAHISLNDGSERSVFKGAGTILTDLNVVADVKNDLSMLASKGYRIIYVVSGPGEGKYELVGLIGFQDPPRSDSKQLIQNLSDLGVRVIMVTGDDKLTAQSVAAELGIPGVSTSSDELKGTIQPHTLESSIFAGVFPEDKFRLVQALQREGNVVGMTGDGVNDAPALKQAEVGIAVSNASDVAKSAASLVLTTPGLSNVLKAIQTSRKIFQRMLTYILNKIIKTFQIALFLSLGYILTKQFIITPLLVILLLFTNDFVTMSISTDHVQYSHKPDHWDIRTIVIVALCLAIPILALSFGLYAASVHLFGHSLEQTQTMMFIMLVFTGQAVVYTVRERHHFWSSFPNKWMLIGTFFDLIVVILLAIKGILMTPIDFKAVLFVFGAVLVFLPLLDFLKLKVFHLGHLV
jgi:H+-transporting ATPase